jgi:putative hydrolase of the HAD superfamily
MRRSRSVLEAVIFDWGGTRTPWHPIDVAEQWHVFARVHAASAGMTTAEAERLAARILAAEESAWRRGREQGGSARLTEILGEVGLQPGEPGVAEAHAAYEEFWEPHTLLDPDVPALWQGLRDRGVRIGVLSNTIWTRKYHERVFARDGVLHLIDGAVYSSEIEYAKPHPEAFAAALAAVGVQDAARALYVGDRPYEDVHGAQQVGLRAAWVPHSDIPVGQQVSGRGAHDVVPDAVVSRLLDLLDVVDAWNG